MRFRAAVRSATGNSKNFYGTIIGNELVPVAPIPVPTQIEIRGEPGGFFLEHFAGDGAFLTDSWHATLEDAMRQAEFEFGTSPDEWTTVEDGENGKGDKGGGDKAVRNQ